MAETIELKNAKRDYKSYKHTEKHRESRNNLIHQMLRSDTPNWGGIVVKLVDNL